LSDKSAAKNAVYDLEPDRIEKRLTANRTDVGREPIPELGFDLSGWSGDPDDETAGFHAHAGAYGKWVGNSFVVNLPRTWSGSSEQVRRLAEVLREVWDPDEIRLFEHRGERNLKPGKTVKGDPGRVLWSRKRGLVARLRRGG
jgi:hypothetical protein